MEKNIQTIQSPDTINQEFNSPLLKGLMKITPKKYLTEELPYSPTIFIIGLSVLILGAILTALNGQNSFFLFFVDYAEEYVALDTMMRFLSPIFFMINFLSLFFFIELFCRLIFNKKENPKEFLIVLPLTLIPMVLYLGFHFFFIVLALLEIMTFIVIDRIVMIFCQVWSLWLLTYLISVKKELRIENALIISLLLHYGSFTIVLFYLI